MEFLSSLRNVVFAPDVMSPCSLIRSLTSASVSLIPNCGRIPVNQYKNRSTAFLIAISALADFGMLAQTPGLRAQQHISFPTQDHGRVYADMYGNGDHGVVLAHGGRFNKESWAKQARALAAAGFRVVAIDFRGYGQSKGPGQSDPLSAPLHFDVLAATRYLRKTGCKTASVVGGSMGRGGCRCGDCG